MFYDNVRPLSTVTNCYIDSIFVEVVAVVLILLIKLSELPSFMRIPQLTIYSHEHPTTLILIFNEHNRDKFKRFTHWGRKKA